MTTRGSGQIVVLLAGAAALYYEHRYKKDPKSTLFYAWIEAPSHACFEPPEHFTWESPTAKRTPSQQPEPANYGSTMANDNK